MPDPNWMQYADRYRLMKPDEQARTWNALTPEQQAALKEALSQPVKGKPRPILIGCLVILGAIMILGAVASLVKGPESKSAEQPSKAPLESVQAKEGSNKTMAWVMAKQFVTDRLKSPSTADFGSLWNGTLQTADDCVRYSGDGKYRCAGWVDSQNAFGAKIRTKFVCVVKDVGNEKWRLESIDFY